MIEELPSEYYSSKTSDRLIYEDRAKKIAKLTLPYVIREPSDNKTTALKDTANQSYGARLINTLKAKMGMALLPPSTSSFKLEPDPEALQVLTGGNPDNIAKVAQQLSLAVDTINKELELQQIRSSLFDIITELLVVGSVVVEKVPKQGVRLHKLQSFVVDLDPQGYPFKLCIYEKLPPESLPQGLTPPKEKEDEDYNLYTLFELQPDIGKWVMTQEIDGELVGDEITFKDYNSLPVRYLGWTWLVGDEYHRPYTEDYYNDLLQLDKLTKLIVDGSIVAAKTLLFVNERGGRTRKDEVALSENGDVIDGVADDVTALQMGKNYDFQIPMQVMQDLKKTLSSAFLMNESVTRDAERVTAQEIRFMAQELETSSLSGIYSKLALQWSRWIVQKIMDELKIKFEEIDVKILTGLDALGRSQEAQRLDSYIMRLAQLNMMDWVNQEELISRYAEFEGINTVNLLKTPNQVAQERQAAAQAQAAAAGEQALMEEGGRQVAQQVINPQQA